MKSIYNENRWEFVSNGYVNEHNLKVGTTLKFVKGWHNRSFTEAINEVTKYINGEIDCTSVTDWFIAYRTYTNKIIKLVSLQDALRIQKLIKL
jgi:hypothetical protein